MKRGLPDRSPRMTSVLTKKPTRFSSSGLLRPAMARADSNIGLLAVAHQHELESRQQHHVEGALFLQGQCLQFSYELVRAGDGE